MKKEAKPYLLHIEKCKFLKKSKNLTFEIFNSDPVIKKAFVRSIEIIDEAVKNILYSIFTELGFELSQRVQEQESDSLLNRKVPDDIVLMSSA